MNEIFNTPFETEMRILIILHAIGTPGASIDRIAAYDFMSVYGKDFGVSDSNLHGSNSFFFSEWPSRRALISSGIKEAALDGLISVNQTDYGILYTINNTGLTFVHSLNTDYAQQYMSAVTKAHSLYSELSDIDVMNYVNNRAITNLRRHI